jgi:DNA polymerase-4
MSAALQPLIDRIWNHCEKTGAQARTVTLKVKYADFRQITRSRSGPAPVASRAELAEIASALLAPLLPAQKPVRLLGLSLSNLGETPVRLDPQMSLAL